MAAACSLANKLRSTIMPNGLTNPRWYALHVRPQCERSVALHLREHAQESFLPTYKKHGPGGQNVSREAPLFPGYVFCRVDWERGFKLYLIPGIIGAVGMGKKPIAIEDDEIEAIRRIAENRMDSEPCPFGVSGTPVRVIKGPLAGIEGIVVKPLAGEIVISISLLRRSVAINIDPECLVILADRASGNEIPGAARGVAEAAQMEYAMV